LIRLKTDFSDIYSMSIRSDIKGLSIEGCFQIEIILSQQSWHMQYCNSFLFDSLLSDISRANFLRKHFLFVQMWLSYLLFSESKFKRLQQDNFLNSNSMNKFVQYSDQGVSIGLEIRLNIGELVRRSLIFSLKQLLLSKNPKILRKALIKFSSSLAYLVRSNKMTYEICKNLSNSW